MDVLPNSSGGPAILSDKLTSGITVGDHDFRKLFTTHPTPMWVYDPETLGFLTVNEAAVQLYGYGRADYARMTVLDIRPEAERARMIAAVQTRSDMEQAECWQHLKANGEIMDVVTYGRAVRFDGRDAILAIVIDRTEVNTAYRQAGEMRSLLDSIVTNLPIGVFVKDMEDGGRYILFNEACGKIVGFEPGLIVGRTDDRIFSDQLAERFRSQDREALTGSGSFTVEESVQRPDGETRFIKTVKRPIPTLDGTPSRYLVGLSEDVTEQRSFEQRISHIALHDALTGLPNRAYFTGHVGKLLEPGGRDFALLYVDIDHFKHVNDSMGHPAGDALLSEVAQRLRALIGPADMVARLGGDEFAITIMLDGDPAVAAIFAGRVRDVFAAPFEIEGVQEHVNCSIGIALAPLHGDDVNVLLRNADLALYAAKGAGRSTFRIYESAMRSHAEKRHALTLELRRALSDGEFELHFQPVVALSDNTVSGFEALLRWRHPERGLIMPAEFIPVAEETGLIAGIGDWVIAEACRTAAGWPRHIKVALNLSPAQFRQTGLLATVIAALGATKLDPRRLECEITETVLLTDSKQNLQTLHGLRQLGVRIAMDDFGTGYSSLSYLRSFPFDKIKLDKSFVSGLETDPGCLAIARAVTGLGSGFNLTTTAEGVETQAQYDRLCREGFDEVQGYLIARAMPAAEVPAFIARHARRAKAVDEALLDLAG